MTDLANRYLEVHAAVHCKPLSQKLYRGILGNHVLPAVVGHILPLTHRAIWSDYLPGETSDVVD